MIVTEQRQLSRGMRVVWLLVAAVILVQSVVEIAAAYRSRRWPTTDAEVTVSIVAVLVGGRSGTSYEPRITYTYRVGGTVYVNDRLSFGSRFQKSSALEMANRYPVGAHLRISYSPDDPHVSVIQPGIRWVSIFKIGLAGGIIVLALWLRGPARPPLAKPPMDRGHAPQTGHTAPAVARSRRSRLVSASGEPEPTLLGLAWQSRSVVLGCGFGLLGLVFFYIAWDSFGDVSRTSESTALGVEGAILSIVGGMLLAFGWRRTNMRWRVAHEGEPGEARIVAINRSRLQLHGYHSIPETTWIIRYEYEDAMGRKRQGRTGYLSEQEVAGWTVGDRGAIRVDRAHPDISVWAGGRPLPAGHPHT